MKTSANQSAAVSPTLSDDYWVLPIALAWVATRSENELETTLVDANHVGMIRRAMKWSSDGKSSFHDIGSVWKAMASKIGSGNIRCLARRGSGSAPLSLISFEALDLSLDDADEPGCPSLKLSGIHSDMYDVRVVSDDVKIAFPFVAIASKGGRRSFYPWPEAKSEFDRLIDHYGRPGADNFDISRQAALELKITTFLEKQTGRTPAESLVRKHVSAWLDDVDKGRWQRPEAEN